MRFIDETNVRHSVADPSSPDRQRHLGRITGPHHYHDTSGELCPVVAAVDVLALRSPMLLGTLVGSCPSFEGLV